MNNITLPSPHKITKIIHETKAEYTFRVKCDIPTLHGQFFMLSIPKIGEAPISVSAKGEDYVEFTIRKVGRLTDGLFKMAEGDTLFMRGPYGNSFPIEDYKGKDLVVIAGGTGLAAVRSLVKHFANHLEEVKSLHLVVGFKDKDAVLFEEELESYRDKFSTIYCLDQMETEGFRKGFVTNYVSEIPFSEFEDYNVVIVGPPVMIGRTAQECLKQGVQEEKIWVSFERKMSCAVGKCGHCKINETYVCLEGPVFNYTKAKELLD